MTQCLGYLVMGVLVFGGLFLLLALAWPASRVAGWKPHLNFTLSRVLPGRESEERFDTYAWSTEAFCVDWWEGKPRICAGPPTSNQAFVFMRFETGCQFGAYRISLDRMRPEPLKEREVAIGHDSVLLFPGETREFLILSEGCVLKIRAPTPAEFRKAAAG